MHRSSRIARILQVASVIWLLAIVAQPSFAEVTYLSRWGANGGDGSSGSGPGEFAEGDGLALSDEGYLYVGDGGNSRVQKFDLNGNFVLDWSLNGNPRGISTDSAGNVYLVRQFYWDLVKYDSSGNEVNSVGGLTYPHGVEVAADDRIYVADLFNNQVRRYDTGFNQETNWYVNYVYDIAFDSNGDLYATSGPEYNVQKFTTDGDPILTWGSPGSGDGEFNSVGRIEISQNDRVYVADGNHRVQIFDTSGNYLAQWGTAGSASGEFNGPAGLSVTEAGHVYVLDNGNHRVQRFFDSESWVTGTNDFTNAAYSPTSVEIGGSDTNVVKSYVGLGDSLSLTSGMTLLVGDVATVRDGGTLTIDGGSLTTPSLVIDAGGRLQGTSDIIGNVSIAGIIAPGSSPGTMAITGSSTWEGGGVYEWEINDATGAAGSEPGWDLYTTTGTLDITATSGSPFAINLLSLTLSNDPGEAANFDDSIAATWVIATALGGVTGFDPSSFTIDVNGFVNAFDGTFGIELLGDSLVLTYQPVCEPTSAMLLLVGLPLLARGRSRLFGRRQQ